MNKSLAFWTLTDANSHFYYEEEKILNQNIPWMRTFESTTQTYINNLINTIVVKRELINMTRAWDKEKIWVPYILNDDQKDNDALNK